MAPTIASTAEGVRARGLVKTFSSPQGPVRAVRGVDISIAAGETVALLGPNGAGKTTTIDMLLGLSRPDAGDVTLFGAPPAEAVRAGAVGAMLQTGGLIRDLTVRELVAMMASLYPHPLDVDDVLALAGLRGVAGQRTQKLSGGETQRARFAMALVGDPGLLVLDEPTVALDVEARRAFWTTMRRFTARGKTVLFATHYLDEADANADRVVLLAAGTRRRRRPADRDQGARRLADHQGDAARRRREAALDALPGVTSVQRHGDAVMLVCSDSDAAIRELLRRHPQARDIEIAGAGLEEAFVRLTGADDGRRRRRRRPPTTSVWRRPDEQPGAGQPAAPRPDRVPPLRAPADPAQPAVLHLRPRLPRRALLPDRRSQPQRRRLPRARGSRRRSTTW